PIHQRSWRPRRPALRGAPAPLPLRWEARGRSMRRSDLRSVATHSGCCRTHDSNPNLVHRGLAAFTTGKGPAQSLPTPMQMTLDRSFGHVEMFGDQRDAPALLMEEQDDFFLDIGQKLERLLQR